MPQGVGGKLRIESASFRIIDQRTPAGSGGANFISPVSDRRKVGVVALGEKGSNVGLSRRRKVFFGQGRNRAMAERAPGVEGVGEEEEKEEGVRGVQGVRGVRGVQGVQGVRGVQGGSLWESKAGSGHKRHLSCRRRARLCLYQLFLPSFLASLSSAIGCDGLSVGDEQP